MYIRRRRVYILYDEGGAVIVVSRPRGVAHGHDDECFWASRGNTEKRLRVETILLLL